MPGESIFSDEWRDCLRAHYTYVVRMSDKGTERTLRTVMFEAGFSDADLKQLYVLATAHVDQVAEDFVPDMEFLEEAQSVVVPAIAVPQEVIEAALVEEAVAQDEQAETESEAEAGEADQDEPPKDEPGITQLSLF